MKKLNFNTLQNLPVPEGWVEKALAIPRQEQKAVVVPLWRKPRVIAAAASLALVSVLSVILFLGIGDPAPLSVKPVSTEIVVSTDASGEVVATEIVIVPDEKQDILQPTEPKSFFDQLTRRVLDTAPAESRPAAPTLPRTDETEAQRPATQPPAPTQSATQTLLEPTESDPWVLPTDVPTEYIPDIQPSEPVWYQPTQTPVYPTVQSTESDPDAWMYQDSILARIPAENVPSGSTLYVRLIDGSGKLLGDQDLYSAQHLADTVKWGNSFVIVTYTPKNYGILPKRDRYRFKIYTQDGTIVYSSALHLNP